MATVTLLHHASRARRANALKEVQDTGAAGIAAEVEGLLLHVGGKVQRRKDARRRARRRCWASSACCCAE